MGTGKGGRALEWGGANAASSDCGAEGVGDDQRSGRQKASERDDGAGEGRNRGADSAWAM